MPSRLLMVTRLLLHVAGQFTLGTMSSCDYKDRRPAFPTLPRGGDLRTRIPHPNEVLTSADDTLVESASLPVEGPATRRDGQREEVEMRSQSLIIGLVLALAPMGILASRFLIHPADPAPAASPHRVAYQPSSRAHGGVELTGLRPRSAD